MTRSTATTTAAISDVELIVVQIEPNCPAGADRRGKSFLEVMMKRLFMIILVPALLLSVAPARAQPPEQRRDGISAPRHHSEPRRTEQKRASRAGRLDDHPLLGDRSVVMPGQDKDWIAVDRGYLPTRDDDRLGSGSVFNEYRR